MGLLRAIDKFDPGRGVAFGTYAVPWIRSFVGRYVDRHQLSRVRGGRKVRIPMVSLDQPITPDGDLSLLETLESADQPAGDALSDHELRQQVRTALGQVRFSGLSRDIIELRLLREEKTLEEIGTAYGVSRERVRQVEHQLRARLARILAPLREAVAP